MAYKKCLIATTKNLFDISKVTVLNAYIYSGQLKIQLSSSDRTLVIPCKPNTTYTFSKMPTNRLFMAETSEENPTIGTVCTNPIESLGEPPKQNYCTLTTTSTAKNLIVTVAYLYNVSYTLQDIINTSQLEEGTTATSYVPYGYLPSYKKIIKVNNNPVQLLDKSKYGPSETISGVTFTNNGDGSFTINGTSTTQIYASLINTSTTTIRLNTSHKYLLSGCPKEGSSSLFLYVDNGGALFGYDTGSGSIGTPTKTYATITISVSKNTVINNAIFKPALYDLTAMYGAGNEPTTVAEFRAKYPNDYYEYNPSQYLVSYRKNLVTDGSTKNLFDFSKFYKNTYSNVANGVLVEKLSNGAIAQGNNGIGNGDNSYSNGWFVPTNYPTSLKIHLKAGTYTLSADYTLLEYNFGDSTVVGCYLYADNHSYASAVTRVKVGETIRIQGTYTIEEDNYNPVFTLNSGKVRVTNIQIEEGSTATSYVPYQYL